jgi:hypothetical protein
MGLLSKILIQLLVLICTTTCMASDNPRLRVYPESGTITFKGLDDTSSPPVVVDGRASDIQNIKLDIDFSATKRYGYSLVDDNKVLDIPDVAFTAVQGIYYAKLSSAKEYWVTVTGGRFYYDDNSLAWTPSAGYGGLTSGQNYQFTWATALDNIIGTNDQDPPIKWTGPGVYTNLSFTGLTYAITDAKCVVWFKNYLIFGNTIENAVERPTRFRWSNIGFIETWSDNDYIDIDALGGQEINGFGILYDALYVFLTDSIYKISYVGGDDIFNVSKVISGIGCIAKNSVQNVTLQNSQEGIIFLDKKGKVFIFNGTTAQELSPLIRTTMTGLNQSRLPYAVSATNGKDYYLGVSDGSATKNDLLLDFQVEIGEWSKHTNIDANCMAYGYDTNSDGRIYFGNYYNFIYKLDDSNTVNDVYGVTGTLDVVNTFTTLTASGLTIYYDNDASFTTSGLMGARLTIKSGTGINEETIIADNTTTGIVVTSAITSGINATYSIGEIDAIYTTKWYHMSEPARRKQFSEMYFWAESGTSDDLSVAYATDYSSVVGISAVDIAGSGSLWGTAIWGTSTWGGTETVMKRVKLNNSGRYMKMRFREPDIDDEMKLYGYTIIFEAGDIY